MSDFGVAPQDQGLPGPGHPRAHRRPAQHHQRWAGAGCRAWGALQRCFYFQLHSAAHPCIWHLSAAIPAPFPPSPRVHLCIRPAAPRQHQPAAPAAGGAPAAAGGGAPTGATVCAAPCVPAPAACCAALPAAGCAASALSFSCCHPPRRRCPTCSPGTVCWRNRLSSLAAAALRMPPSSLQRRVAAGRRRLPSRPAAAREQAQRRRGRLGRAPAQWQQQRQRQQRGVGHWRTSCRSACWRLLLPAQAS